MVEAAFYNRPYLFAARESLVNQRICHIQFGRAYFPEIADANAPKISVSEKSR